MSEAKLDQTSRLADFLAARAAETYPEPRMTCHDTITTEMAPNVAKFIPSGGSVLDAGCGQGPALEWFKKAGYFSAGITTNIEDYRACIVAPFNAHLLDMHNIGDHFEPAVFDLVWARHVLEHSPIPFFVLTEFARVLKPEGILYVEVPAPGTSCLHERNPNHYSVLGLDMWRNLIERAGFRRVEERAINLTTPQGPDIYWSLICRRVAQASSPVGPTGVPPVEMQC